MSDPTNHIPRSCGSAMSVTYKSEPLKTSSIRNKTLNMRNVDFKVLTRANVEEEFKKIEESGTQQLYLVYTQNIMKC